MFDIFQRKFSFISSSTLKIIAIVTMFIDHVAAGVLLYMIRGGMYPFGMDREQIIDVYDWMRHIGRQSFPIFCFLLVEGLFHTKNLRKYVLNMAIFSIISELFFDILFKVRVDVANPNVIQLLQENWEKAGSNTNVFFTLMIGLLVIWMMKLIEERFFDENEFAFFGFTVSNPLYMLLYYMPAAVGSMIAWKIGSDYSFWGVTLIAIFFIFRNQPLLASIFGYVFLSNMGGEAWALPAFILIYFYNGERGFIKGNYKYVVYAFYPLHLLLLFIVRLAVFGIAN
ncbi:TraX family protein [Butyrivibrio sp. AE3006]|uniref:TraX family protein n=1 Tax=Butyrivibrio sp. AE3006 TaxID=1280673 RepID=UPI0009DB9FB0|nr:TraX family protein [Butyrivibrio sp. AE3006]